MIFSIKTSQMFAGGDALWQSFQNKINQFVNSNGGSSVVSNPQIHRVNAQKVLDVLNGVKPIKDLGCTK